MLHQLAIEYQGSVPGSVEGKIARLANQSVPHGSVLRNIAQRPYLGMEHRLRFVHPWRQRGHHGLFQERQHRLASPRHRSLSAVAEKYDAPSVAPGALQKGQRVGSQLAVAVLGIRERESQGHRQQRHQVQGVGGAHGKVEGISVGGTKGIQEKPTVAGFQH